MSKLEELIQKLCPNGVEYKTLGEVCSVITKQTGFDYTNHIKASLLIEPTSTSIPYIQTKFFSKKNLIIIQIIMFQRIYLNNFLK